MGSNSSKVVENFIENNDVTGNWSADEKSKFLKSILDKSKHVKIIQGLYAEISNEMNHEWIKDEIISPIVDHAVKISTPKKPFNEKKMLVLG